MTPQAVNEIQSVDRNRRFRSLARSVCGWIEFYDFTVDVCCCCGIRLRLDDAWRDNESHEEGKDRTLAVEFEWHFLHSSVVHTFASSQKHTLILITRLVCPSFFNMSSHRRPHRSFWIRQIISLFSFYLAFDVCVLMNVHAFTSRRLDNDSSSIKLSKLKFCDIIVCFTWLACSFCFIHE